MRVGLRLECIGLTGRSCRSVTKDVAQLILAAFQDAFIVREYLQAFFMFLNNLRRRLPRKLRIGQFPRQATGLLSELVLLLLDTIQGLDQIDVNFQAYPDRDAGSARGQGLGGVAPADGGRIPQRADRRAPRGARRARRSRADPRDVPGGIARAAVSAPPFRAEHIGSLLRPKKLLEDRAREDECILEAIRWQESARSPVGHRRRVPPRVLAARLRLEGGRVRARRRGRQRRRAARRRRQRDATIGSAPVAVTRMRRTGPIVADEVAFSLRNATAHGEGHAPCAVLSPLSARHATASTATSIRSSRSSSSDVVDVYVEELDALHAAGGRYVQIDEVAQTLLCDEHLRDAVRARGDDPERLIDLYIDLINRVVRGRPAGMTVGVHMCRGNAMGKWVAEGGYERIAEKAFARLEVDAFFLEFDTERAGGFEPLRFVPKGKRVVLGLVSHQDAARSKTRRPQAEDRRGVALRSARAPLDQPAVRLRQPRPGQRARTFAEQEAKLQAGCRDLATEVWGDA